MTMLRSIMEWFEARLQLGNTIAPIATHKVPRNAKWWYVFGSATLTVFLCQILTGTCLAFVYVPAADGAYASLEYLNYQATLGWMLRALHVWGSHFMVGLMSIHMIQVFLMGAFKYPRELTWVVGVFLFLCTLGMAFTGQVLRWDQDAYWGTGVGMAMMGRIPWIGPEIVHLVLGGPIIGGGTLTRFFALHVFIIPGSLLMLIGIHLHLVLKCGISPMPEAGKPTNRETTWKDEEKETHRTGVAFFPDAAQRDMVFIGVIMIALVACAAIFGPSGPNGIPDPAIINANPRPDIWFMSLFASLALLPAPIETFLTLVAPVVGVLGLLLIPFIVGTGERSPTRRPISVLCTMLIVLTMSVLTFMGYQSDWSPIMNAWSGIPTPTQYIQNHTPLQMQGAIVLQNKQCRNCHELGGQGGRRGPALDFVAMRLTRDQLVRQVIEGGGNMPAFGTHLSPSETTALVDFLSTMHAPDQRPAQTPLTPTTAQWGESPPAATGE
jgi:ubiquinol-cytochrome c reductase cytochrome b subunit